MDQSGAARTKVFFENLDSLRFFAFLSVFLSHCLNYTSYYSSSRVYSVLGYFLVQGDLGVNFFFVLSGFLISFLLFREYESGGKIQIKHFYVRRILRIWPVYFALICIGFLIALLVHYSHDITKATKHSLFTEISSLPFFALFLANFALLLKYKISFLLIGLWSVSVEEQFYFVWPLLLNLFKPKNIIRVLWLLILVSFLYKCSYLDRQDYIKYSSFSVMADICIGAIMAYYATYKPSFTIKLGGLKKPAILLVYFAGFLLFVIHGYLSSHYTDNSRFYRPFESLFFSAFFAFIILEQNYCLNSPFKAGKLKLFSYLGKISYGLYCYHAIGIFIGSYFITSLIVSPKTGVLSFLLIILSSLFITLILAFFSYIAMEKRLLKLKEKFSFR